MKIFETFECLGEFCQIPYANFETTIRFLSKFCIPLHFHEKLFLCTFLAQTIYNLLKRSLLKWKSLTILSTQFEICEIPYTNFEITSQFLSIFCIPLQLHEKLFICIFFAKTIYTLLKMSSFKWKFLRLSSAHVKFFQIPYANFETKSQ